MSKTVLVTGASGDIGSAIATAFAQAGYNVVLGCHSNPERAHQLQSQLQAQGHSCMVCKADVARQDEVAHMFEEVRRTFGDVDILVNNAGISQQKLFDTLSLDDWERMMAVHVTGTFLCCRQAMRSMLAKKSGCIVNIASMWGQVGAACEVHYSAAKAAVIGLTRALAKESGPSGIRVNCVAPGVVEGVMMQPFSQDERESLNEQTPLGRAATPKDVADAAMFLASDAAGFITGQVLAVNGGFVV